MAIIVAGSLMIKPTYREEFLLQSCEAILQARANESCIDFSVCADSIEPNRVNIFELWHSKQSLNAFRQAGNNQAIFNLVESFSVNEYEVIEPV